MGKGFETSFRAKYNLHTPQYLCLKRIYDLRQVWDVTAATQSSLSSSIPGVRPVLVKNIYVSLLLEQIL